MQEMERKAWESWEGCEARALLSLLEVSLLVNRCGTTSSLADNLSGTDVYNFLIK